jgi:hypothetical protein
VSIHPFEPKKLNQYKRVDQQGRKRNKGRVEKCISVGYIIGQLSHTKILKLEGNRRAYQKNGL